MTFDDLLANPAFGLDWLAASGPDADIALSTRVRLARNLHGHRYVCRARSGDLEAVFDAVASAVASADRPDRPVLMRITELPADARRLLLERRLVSSDLLEADSDAAGTGVALYPGASMSVMVNEEDHLRLQGLLPGLKLKEAWSRMDRLDEDFGRSLRLAYHEEFGFLTACPTNTGTGLRASVLLHLPGLVLTKEIRKALRGVGEVGLTTRGFRGEGSGFMGNLFQVSNQTTLGQCEEDLVDHLDRVVATVIDKEREARSRLMRHAGTVTEDKIWRAYGVLRHARTLEYEELMSLLSGVRLGVALDLLPSPPAQALNRMMIFAQTGHLEDAAGGALSPPERQGRRASHVRRILRGGNGGGGERGGGSGRGGAASGSGT